VLFNYNARPYKRVEELYFEPQQKIAQNLNRVVLECFEPSSIRVMLGFGSFWQHFQGLKSNSDIDLFILLAFQPSLKALRELRIGIIEQVQPLEPRYLISAHIFVGEASDVANGAENLVRCITIHNPSLEQPVIIMGDPDFHLLPLIDIASVTSWLRQALFSITRNLNYYVLEQPKNVLVDNHFRQTQQKFAQRFIKSVILVQDFFPQAPKILQKDSVTKFLDRELSIDEIFSVVELLWTHFDNIPK
jgi:hypothetical protein